MSGPNIVRPIGRFDFDDHLQFLTDLGVGGFGLGLIVDDTHLNHRCNVGGVDDGAADVWAGAKSGEGDIIENYDWFHLRDFDAGAYKHFGLVAEDAADSNQTVALRLNQRVVLDDEDG